MGTVHILGNELLALATAPRRARVGRDHTRPVADPGIGTVWSVRQVIRNETTVPPTGPPRVNLTVSPATPSPRQTLVKDDFDRPRHFDH
ncbi:hypothetical protein [Cutibacterium sp. V947]|uniref:hypothetical protein n=1 Tax=Cutibacterium sp. V947 TaxID=3446480 RepID=UPI003EE16140